MKKLVLVLLGCLLLGGCSRKTEAAVEYVSDEAALQGVYTISFDIPEGVEETALGTSGTLYSDPDGNYTIAAEQIAAKTLEEAVEMFTKEAAYASYDEAKYGTITVGKYADLVVLDRNIYDRPLEELCEAQVDLTMVEGEIVFQR